MTIQYQGNQLSTKHLGSIKINKIMLGVTEVYPRVVPPIIITVPGGVPHMTQYVAITPFTVVAAGGVGPYVFTIVGGAFPTGITMTTGGYVTGTPIEAGLYNVIVRATDSQDRYSEVDYTGNVEQAGTAYDPSFLFGSNENGGWWDLEDIGHDGNMVLGAEVNPQPEFDASAGWFVGSNNAISGGKFIANNGWSAGQSSYTNALVFGKTYFVEFEVVDFVGVGSFQVRMGNAPSADGVVTVSGNGVYSAVLACKDISGGSRLAIECTSAAGFSMAMTYLRVKEVLSGYNPVLLQDSPGAFPVTLVAQPLGLEFDKRFGSPIEVLADTEFDVPAEWYETTGTGWSVSGGQAVYANSPAVNSYLNANVPAMVAGKTYHLTFNVKTAAGGSYTAIVGGASIAWLSGTGTKSQIITAGSVNQLLTFRSNDATSLVITEVSLREVSPNYLAMATAAARPLLGSRTNMLVYSENFGGWSAAGCTTAPSAVPPPVGFEGCSVTEVFNGVSDTRGRVSQNVFGIIAGTTYCYTQRLKAGAEPRNLLNIGSQNYNNFGVTFDILTGVITAPPAGAAIASITALGDDWHEVSLQFTAGTTVDSQFMVGFGGQDLGSTPTMSFLATAAQLNVVKELGTAPTPPPYQRINTATDYDGSSFPAYESFDGVDDNISNTANVVMSNGADLYACFGCWINGDTAFGMLAESGVSNADGGFYIGASKDVLEIRINGASGTFYYEEFSMIGFTDQELTIDVAMDRAAVVAQTAILVSFNGVPQTRTNITNTLGGNATLFTANPLYIGSRAGSSLRLKGRIYNKTILGRKITAGERTNQQNWSMAQMGVTP